MGRDETTDIVAAFLIGAALGIGATFLLRGDDEGEVVRALRKLRKQRPRQRATRALSAARSAGEDLVGSGRNAAAALRDDASEIVASARKEILSLAREGVRRVRTSRRGQRKRR
jgi:hypothetical protein